MQEHSRSRGQRSATNWSLKTRRSFSNPFAQASWQFWLLAAFLMAVFAMGGSARGDIQSLIVLRPLAALVLGLGCVSLSWKQVKSYQWLFVLALACMALAVVQILPLPAYLSDALAGHDMIAKIDQIDGGSNASRSLSLAPSLTWNAFWSMVLPSTVLVLGVQMSASEHQKLLTLVLIIGVLSASFGLVQTLSEQQSSLYLYDDMGRGLPVGLLTNRNCQAVFLASLLPMLGVWVRLKQAALGRDGESRIFVYYVGAVLVGLCLLPIILLTGSRMGTMAGILACLGAPFVASQVSRAKVERRQDLGLAKQSDLRSHGLNSAFWVKVRKAIPLLALFLGFLLAALAMSENRALSIDRIFGQSVSDDLRIQILPTLKTIFGQYWEFGTGLGTFKPIYRVFESDSVLMPSIMNHAHNDWLEVVVTGGVGGTLIFGLAISLWFSRLKIIAATLKSTSRPYFVRLGLFTVFVFAFGSLTDYHIRTPSITCLITLAAIWAASVDKLQLNATVGGNKV